MAEEGTLELGRSYSETEDGEDAPSKEELQRRMEEARESISQTVTEIKEAVTNQYNSMKETVTEALDWRHHFRKNPVAFSVGALSAGFLVGWAVGGRLRGGTYEDYPSYDETDLYASTGAEPTRLGEAAGDYAARPSASASRYEEEDDYAQSAEAGGHRAAAFSGAGVPSARQEREEEEPKGPSLFDRFKGTSAYERLEKEVSSLGDRFIDELSTTAHTVVLPSLFNKIKELFGVDLSGGKGQQQGRPAQAVGGAPGGGKQPQPEGGRQQEQGQQRAEPSGGAENAQAASASASLANASRGSSYGTSENRPYDSGSSSQGEAGRSGSGADSILDLDR